MWIFTTYINSIFYRLYSTPINLYKQNNYCNDGDNVRFPWYNDNAVITIEGPTDKHSIVQVLVRLNFFYEVILKVA